MATGMNKALVTCLRSLLRPVVRFCINRSLRLQDMVEAAKVMFVDIANEELEKQGKADNISRISVMTGVHRIDVKRILDEGGNFELSERLAGKVIALWRNDKRFTTDAGKPRVLSFKGVGNEFSKLVETISIDLKPGTILFDLERVGAVSKTKKGLKLLHSSYVPRKDPGSSLKLLARDAEDLMEAGINNVEAEGEILNYQASTVYDNISPDDLPKIRKWFFQHCFNFQQRVDKYLAKYDLDYHPDPKKEGGCRVSLGLFSRTTD